MVLVSLLQSVAECIRQGSLPGHPDRNRIRHERLTIYRRPLPPDQRRISCGRADPGRSSRTTGTVRWRRDRPSRGLPARARNQLRKRQGEGPAEFRATRPRYPGLWITSRRHAGGPYHPAIKSTQDNLTASYSTRPGTAAAASADNPERTPSFMLVHCEVPRVLEVVTWSSVCEHEDVPLAKRDSPSPDPGK